MLPNGIYFGLSFEDYLAEERVSGGSIADAIEGPSKWWANSWLNPDREDRDSEAMKLGRAYHCARLEPDKFHELYCRQLVQEDFEGEGLLTNGTEIGNALADLGEPKKKSGEAVMDQAARLHSHPGFEGKIWQIELATWEHDEKGSREAISPKQWDQILRDQERIRANPEIATLLSQGFPEVSILWTDERTLLPCKCRPDWLSATHMTHLKTWDARAIGKPGNLSVVDAFRFNGYHWSGWFYLMGAEWLRTAEEIGIFGESPKAKATKEQLELVRAIRARAAPLQTWFLFLRRSGIPDIRAREIKWLSLPPGIEEQKLGTSTEAFRHSLTGLGMKAELEVRAALDSIHEGLELFGPKEPWFPRDLIGQIDDDDFGEYWLESRSLPR